MYWIGLLLLILVVLVVAYFLFQWMGRMMAQGIVQNLMEIIMTKEYGENLWEYVSATTRQTPQIIAETHMRAQEGKAISRLLGPAKRMPNMDRLMFSPAQFYAMPTHLDASVDLRVQVGPKAKKTMELDIPIMISGMSYGDALSKGAKVALAAGADWAGTAICSGEGPFLPEEREATKRYILQYNRGNWSKEPETLAQADAIEIQFGQGASAGLGHSTKGQARDEAMGQANKRSSGEDGVTNSRQPEVQHSSQLPKLFEKLRKITGGVPIGVKIATGMLLEKDLELILPAKPDFIVLDGGEAATKGSAPILQDDFGLPLVFALSRADQYLKEQGVRRDITLVASGRLRTPGEFLKALALGADVVYIGSAALLAVSHNQMLKSLPFELPTQVLWHDGKDADQFDVQKGAESLHKFLESCKMELEEGVKALGKHSLKEIAKEDLFTYDEMLSKGLNIPMAYQAPSQENKQGRSGPGLKRHF